MQKNRKISVRWLAVTFPACKKNLEGSYSILGISQLDVKRRRQSFLSANLLIISIFRSKKDISLLVTPSLLPLFILPAPTLIVQWGKKSLQWLWPSLKFKESNLETPSLFSASSHMPQGRKPFPEGISACWRKGSWQRRETCMVS